MSSFWKVYLLISFIIPLTCKGAQLQHSQHGIWQILSSISEEAIEDKISTVYKHMNNGFTGEQTYIEHFSFEQRFTTIHNIKYLLYKYNKVFIIIIIIFFILNIYFTSYHQEFTLAIKTNL